MTDPVAFFDIMLQQHVSILGKTGSGKTSTAKLCVERIARQGGRVCILDPIKSDWWGLTSSADGTRAGLPFYILGGPRAHVPLHSGAGGAIGELVATGAMPLSIIDMADFGPGGDKACFIDFAQALMRHMRGVLHLVIEEAHTFAPKSRDGVGEESVSVHWASKLATAGRSKGIRIIAGSQRTQKLHNDVLGSSDTIIAHRLTAPADQKPILDWLKANTDRATADEVDASLSSLKTGEAWVCSGEAKIFRRVQFPPITTYDNSRTPDAGDGDHRVTTAAVDAAKLKALIGDAVKDAAENDPKKLAAEVKELRKKLNDALRAPLPVGPDTDLVAKVNEQLCEAQASLEVANGNYTELSGMLRNELDEIEFRCRSIRDRLTTIDDRREAAKPECMPVTYKHTKPPAAPQPAPVTREPAPRGNRPPGAATTGPQKRILDALGWWESVGQTSPTAAQVAVVAGYSPGTGTIKNYFGEMTGAGLIERANGIVTLMPAGRALAHVPARQPTLRELHARIMEILDGPGKKIIQAVLDRRGRQTSAAEIAEASGYAPGTGTVKNYFGALSRLGLIVRANGQVRATAVLYPEGLR